MKFWLWLRWTASVLFLAIVIGLWWFSPDLPATGNPEAGRPAPEIVR
ncbi:hypothetical protein [uncultured Sphaerotilus sp.]